MKYILLLVVSFFFGKMVWRLILKKSAYPDHITKGVKVTHAIILFYVLMYGWSGFYSLMSAFVHPFSTTWETSGFGGAFVGPVLVLDGVAGTILLFVCSAMAKRQCRALKWFFVLWPITFFSSGYVAVVREQSYQPMQTILIGMIFPILIFAMIIAFYSARSKAIFLTVA
jgi:hypothetical protein